jgi:hypothetical protein
MQTPTTPPANRSNFWKGLAIIGALAFGLCCLVILFVINTSGDPSTSTTNQPFPTSTPGSQQTEAEPAATTGPAPTQTAAQAELGTTRDQPLPMNTTVDIGGGMQVTILEVVRPADDIVIAGNMFNDTPVPGAEEYLMVKLQVDCTQSSNEKCNFNHYEFKTVGADGQVHDPASVAGIPEEFEPFAEFFGGASLTGNIAFLAAQGDEAVVLFYDPLIFGDPVYLALQ